MPQPWGIIIITALPLERCFPSCISLRGEVKTINNLYVFIGQLHFSYSREIVSFYGVSLLPSLYRLCSRGAEHTNYNSLELFMLLAETKMSYLYLSLTD